MSSNLKWMDNVIDIEPYVAGEQPRDSNIIKLNANENPYSPSPMIKEILINSELIEKLNTYPDSDSQELIYALAEYRNLSSNNVFCGNGSDEVLALAFRAFFNSKKPIVFPNITYSFYPVWCNFFKIPYNTFELTEEHYIDIENFNKNEEKGGIVIANPNAPTSIALKRSMIESVLMANSSCVVIVDEAYGDFLDNYEEYSVISLVKKYDNLLVTRTFSKGRSLAGIRLGVAYGSEKLISILNSVKNSFNSYPVNTLTQLIGMISIRDEMYFRKTIDKIKTTRDKFIIDLHELGFIVPNSSANFVFVTHSKYGAREMYEFVKSRDVLIRHFPIKRLENYLRISVGRDEDMEKLIHILKEYVSG